MKIEIKGTVEASEMSTSAEEIKAILEKALKENICPFPYSIDIQTKEI